jgi:hypothetical protein
MKHDTYGCKECDCRLSSQELMGQPKPVRLFSGEFLKENVSFVDSDSIVKRPFSTLKLLSRVLTLSLVLEIGTIIYFLTFSSDLSYVITLRQLGPFFNTVSVENILTTQLGLVLVLGIIVPRIFLFWFWFYKAYANLASLGAKGLRFTPKQVSILYIVPIVNFWMQYTVMMEIWKASHPDTNKDNSYDWCAVPRPKLVVWWWITFIIPLSYWIFVQLPPMVGNVAQIVLNFTGAVSNILLIFIVIYINSWQQAKNQGSENKPNSSNNKSANK